MIAQVILTSSESRKIIARAISQLDKVKEALKRFRIIIGTSSITPDIIEAMGFGPIPEKERGFYICGMIRGEGLCTTDFDVVRDVSLIEKGRLANRVSREILQSIGAGDIYIKSPNILDANGRAGVLAGAPKGGFVAQMIHSLENQEYTVIAPTLLLKSAPIDLRHLTETISQENYTRDASDYVTYSCGMPVNLVPLPKRTRVVTEIEAIGEVFGLSAKPIGMSGVGSGADAIALSVEGSEEDVRSFWEYVCSIKGSNPIVAYPSNCRKCPDAMNPNRCGGYLRPHPDSGKLLTSSSL